MKPNDLFAHGNLFIFFCIIFPHDVSTAERFLCFQQPQNTASLRSIAYDETRDVFYVGAVDSIYQLSPVLDILNSRQLGPACSSGAAAEPCKNCTDARSICSGNGKRLSSISQMLFIDSTARLLVACSNAYNGSCQAFSLNDLSPTSTLREKVSFLPSDASVATVGFIGRGQNGASVLYVGVSYSPESDNSSALPLISIRNHSSLELIASVLDLNKDVRHTFSIEFVAAFQSARYVYFFIRRQSSGALAAFLLRICKDKPKKTLVEMPVHCSARGSNFPHLRAAILAPYSSNGEVVDAVYAIFTKDSGSDSVENSTLCVYLISNVNQEYQKAIKNCFNGSGVTGPRYAKADTRQCIAMVSVLFIRCCLKTKVNIGFITLL